MDFFWGNMFEYFKDRRYAAVFFGTLLAIGGLIIAGVIAVQAIVTLNLQIYYGYALAGAALVFIVLIIRVIRQSRARRKERYKISPMSRDELNKARSKLVNNKR